MASQWEEDHRGAWPPLHLMSRVPAIDKTLLVMLTLITRLRWCLPGFFAVKLLPPSHGAYFKCQGFPSCASRADILYLHRYSFWQWMEYWVLANYLETTPCVVVTSPFYTWGNKNLLKLRGYITCLQLHSCPLQAAWFSAHLSRVKLTPHSASCLISAELTTE